MVEPVRALRSALTPFALELAAALPALDGDLHLAILTPAGAAPVMTRLLERLGLTDLKRILHAPSTGGGPTWAERPDVFVDYWGGGREDAIVLRSNEASPVQMSFFRRVASDRVEQTYVLGYAYDRGRAVRRALWDVGLREITAAIRKTAPSAFVEAVLARGWEVVSEDEQHWQVRCRLVERP